MGNSQLPTILGSVIGDIIGALTGLPGGGTLGALSGAAFERLFSRRIQVARDILVEQISDGQRPISDIQEQDELAAILYRYLEAARQGAAHLNLRLLAKVVNGQYEQESLQADQFLRYADMLATLSREEVIFLAALHKHFAAAHGEDNTQTFQNVLDELATGDRSKLPDIKAVAIAVQRTGLVLPVYAPIGTAMGFYCTPSPLLTRAINLASFEDALRETRENG